MSKLPALFVSHGSPMLAITDSPAQRYLMQLGKALPRPKAVVIISAHWESSGVPAVSLATAPETIHDFGGFSAALYRIQYRAPGAPELAEQAAMLLQEAGFPVQRSRDRGLDHGAWIPMYLMYPDADIPTFQISLLRGAGAAEHERMGRALATLREQGVLIIGSGLLTHNLYEFGGKSIDAPVPTWVSDFSTWMMAHLHGTQTEALLDYRQQAPFAVRNHPTDEHLMPLFVAMGVAGENWQAERIHASVEYGVLAMDVYAFS